MENIAGLIVAVAAPVTKLLINERLVICIFILFYFDYEKS
jgi:hypothetical protein